MVQGVRLSLDRQCKRQLLGKVVERENPLMGGAEGELLDSPCKGENPGMSGLRGSK